MSTRKTTQNYQQVFPNYCKYSPFLTNANSLEEFIRQRIPVMDRWTSFVKLCLQIIIILLYIPQCTNADTILKQTISQVLSNEQWAKVRLLTVSYPENFLKTETSIFSRSLVVEGERMKSLMTRKTTESLGCSFNCVWELDRHNSLGDCPDNEKALYIFQKLVELEKSDAPFKDTYSCFKDLILNFYNEVSDDFFYLSTVEHWILIWESQMLNACALNV